MFKVRGAPFSIIHSGLWDLADGRDYSQYYGGGVAYTTKVTRPISLSWVKKLDPEKQFFKSLFFKRTKKNTFVIINKATLKLSVMFSCWKFVMGF